MDNVLTQWINAAAGQNEIFDAVMRTIANHGVTLMIILVAGLCWLGSPAPDMRHTGRVAGGALVLGLCMAELMLLFIHRQKPYDAGISHLIISPTPDGSFPSDYAIAATSIAFIFLFNRVAPVWTTILGAMAVLICLSRIYVGMHYVSDVLGGVAVGLLAALIVNWAYPHDSELERRLSKWL